MTDELLVVRADIAFARKWARKHFNAYIDEETTPSHLLAQPTMNVEFPEPDTMHVRPMSYGKALGGLTEAKFRLCWKGKNGLVWKGNFLIRKELYGEGDVIELRVI